MKKPQNNYCLPITSRVSYRIFWCVCVWGGGGGGGGGEKFVGHCHSIMHEFAAHVL